MRRSSVKGCGQGTSDMSMGLPNKPAMVLGKKRYAFDNKCRQMPWLLEKLLRFEI